MKDRAGTGSVGLLVWHERGREEPARSDAPRGEGGSRGDSQQEITVVHRAWKNDGGKDAAGRKDTTDSCDGSSSQT